MVQIEGRILKMASVAVRNLTTAGVGASDRYEDLRAPDHKRVRALTIVKYRAAA